MDTRDDHMIEVGVWKLAGMLLVTWIPFPFFVGLGNLIWLWRDMHYRRRAAVALGVSLRWSIAMLFMAVYAGGWYLLLAAFGVYWTTAVTTVTMAITYSVPLGLAVWMTIDAVKAYKVYGPGQGASPRN